jgi:hypothetical protein
MWLSTSEVDATRQELRVDLVIQSYRVDDHRANVRVPEILLLDPLWPLGYNSLPHTTRLKWGNVVETLFPFLIRPFLHTPSRLL